MDVMLVSESGHQDAQKVGLGFGGQQLSRPTNALLFTGGTHQ
jgi:hypothetical protein